MKDRLIEWLADAGFERKPDGTDRNSVLDKEFAVTGTSVIIGGGEGYSFYGEFTFDDAGNLKNYGLWE